MKINNIIVDNVLGLSSIDIMLHKPVTLFAGKNFAGKTSIRQCVAAALTQDVMRADLKREYVSLVKEGAKSGTVEVRTSSGNAMLELPSGNPGGDFVENMSLIRAVLDSERFMQMTEAERRAFLFGLAGIKINADEVAARLVRKGCDEKIVATVKPTLAAGFETAQKQAAGKATEARGAWKATAGETYGDKKAATWAATVDALTDAESTEASALDAEIVRTASELSAKHQRLGAIQQSQKQVEEHERKLDEAKRALEGQTSVAWASEETELANLRHEVSELRQKASGKPSGVEVVCVECGAAQIFQNEGTGGGKLVAKKTNTASAKAEAELPDAAKRLADMEERVKGLRAQAERYDAAKAKVQDLTASTPVALNGIAEVQAVIETMTQDHNAKRARQQELRAKLELAELQTKKNRQAKEYHEQVQAWSKVADALAPDGIPSEILAEGLKPINNRLRDSSIATGWAQVRIDPDMQIRAEARPWRLLSKSEQWRVGAMITEAVSHLSKLNMLMLDEVDVLDSQGRVDLVIWLDQLAAAGEIESALLFGTFKARPAGLPETIDVRWVEAGTIPERVAEPA